MGLGQNGSGFHGDGGGAQSEVLAIRYSGMELQ